MQTDNIKDEISEEINLSPDMFFSLEGLGKLLKMYNSDTGITDKVFINRMFTVVIPEGEYKGLSPLFWLAREDIQ